MPRTDPHHQVLLPYTTSELFTSTPSASTRRPTPLSSLTVLCFSHASCLHRFAIHYGLVLQQITKDLSRHQQAHESKPPSKASQSRIETATATASSFPEATAEHAALLEQGTFEAPPPVILWPIASRGSTFSTTRPRPFSGVQPKQSQAYNLTTPSALHIPPRRRYTRFAPDTFAL
ncbi:hypothetical protein G7046_g1702 [Stylonectria norvegica]|nr:hypothetical protein G7046_g1702 [Stylonectria norvegica]